MTSRERVRTTLHFRNPDRVPRDLWYPIGIEMFRRAELDALLAAYPRDFSSPRFRYGRSGRERGRPGAENYIDAWGCGWSLAEPGVVGKVTAPAIEDWSDLGAYTPPWDMLDHADLSEVNRSCAQADTFVLLVFENETRPFERMQFLRGTENLFLDLASGERRLERLRDMVHEFCLREVRLWADTDIDGFSLDDDWGSQGNLLIPPEQWRSFFKPMYRDYCDVLHAKGKHVFFHSDGNIESIIADLIEIGVDALNCQLFCMDLEGLAERYAGRITFWGEIDQQFVLPFGSTDEVRGAVRRVRRAFSRSAGGVIAQCAWNQADPRENIEAVFDEWLQPPGVGT
jgi:hypothetical protein